MTKELNKSIVSQARRFVWATDDSQLEFIRRHIAKAPDRVIITEAQKHRSTEAQKHRSTEAQKQEALAAARGDLVVQK